jgi:hypothetical protein
MIVSHLNWRRYWDSQPTALGEIVEINGRAFTLVGVAPEGFGRIRDLRIWS